MSDVVISVKGLSKRYRVGVKEVSHDSLLQSALHSIKAPFRGYHKLKQLTHFTKEDETVFWALRDINFEVKQGEVMGIIGHNGAGKSTLLKILSRITEPTSGEIKIKGRVSALLEVGTGFHPDLTGRDNVYMNGTILGMTKKEIDQRFDEIIEFSGVEKHVDTPVKFYSSGMKVRLGFAVAAHLEPEILIVDEVLSVGDIGFQRKCLGKMNEVASSGRTVIFVSHNMAAVENLCTSGCLLDHGKMSIQDKIETVINNYVHSFRVEKNDFFLGEVKRLGTGQVNIVGFTVANREGSEITAVQIGDDLVLEFHYKSNLPVRNLNVGFSILSVDTEQMLVNFYSSYVGQTFDLTNSKGKLSCIIENISLSPGRYIIKAQLLENGSVVDYPVKGVGYLDILEGDYYGTGVKSNSLTRDQPPFLIKGKWTLVN